MQIKVEGNWNKFAQDFPVTEVSLSLSEQAAVEITGEIYKNMENQFIEAFPNFAGFTDEHIKQLNNAFSYRAYDYECKISKSKQSRRVMVKKSI
jgi:hypothetical protein